MYKLKTKWVSKWARKNNIDDESLILAIENLKKGLSSYNLGGGLYKVRVVSQSSGKSSDFHTIKVTKL